MVELKSGAVEGIIWIPEFNRRKVRNLATLSHECSHLALNIADRAGFLPKSFDTAEPICYLQGYFFEEILRKLRK